MSLLESYGISSAVTAMEAIILIAQIICATHRLVLGLSLLPTFLFPPTDYLPCLVPHFSLFLPAVKVCFFTALSKAPLA